MISTYWGATELTYAMTKTYLEDINFLLTRQRIDLINAKYMDLDWGSVSVDDIIIQCHSYFRSTNCLQ